jgi:hypothetical protein
LRPASCLMRRVGWRRMQRTPVEGRQKHEPGVRGRVMRPACHARDSREASGKWYVFQRDARKRVSGLDVLELLYPSSASSSSRRTRRCRGPARAAPCKFGAVLTRAQLPRGQGPFRAPGTGISIYIMRGCRVHEPRLAHRNATTHEHKLRGEPMN